MSPRCRPLQLVTIDPLDDKPAEELAAKYFSVLSKKGAMLRLHKMGGCWRAQNLAFASYEVCSLDPVPTELYSHYCHTCWPSGIPQDGASGDGALSSSDSDSSSASAVASSGTEGE